MFLSISPLLELMTCPDKTILFSLDLFVFLLIFFDTNRACIQKDLYMVLVSEKKREIYGACK